MSEESFIHLSYESAIKSGLEKAFQSWKNIDHKPIECFWCIDMLDKVLYYSALYHIKGTATFNIYEGILFCECGSPVMPKNPRVKPFPQAIKECPLSKKDKKKALRLHSEIRNRLEHPDFDSWSVSKDLLLCLIDEALDVIKMLINLKTTNHYPLNRAIEEILE